MDVCCVQFMLDLSQWTHRKLTHSTQEDKLLNQISSKENRSLLFSKTHLFLYRKKKRLDIWAAEAVMCLQTISIHLPMVFFCYIYSPYISCVCYTHLLALNGQEVKYLMLGSTEGVLRVPHHIIACINSLKTYIMESGLWQQVCVT